MKWLGLKAFLPLALAVAPVAACDKAKDALASAIGADQLDKAEVDALLLGADWDVTKNKQLAHFTIHGGMKLTDKFKGDLAKSVTIPIPFDLPAQANQKAGNVRSIALLKSVDITVGGVDYKRFQIVSVGKYDAEAKQLDISGDTINQYLDSKQAISVDNGNQAGSYLLVEGKGDTGLAYLTGKVEIKKADGSANAVVQGTIVFTSSSPFVTQTGSEGKYFLAMLADSKGQVIGFKGDIATALAAPGTPTSAVTEIAYAGAGDKYKEAFTAKVGAADNAEVSGKADELFNKANTKITTLLDAWTLVEANLLFVQPPQTPPAEPVPPAPPVDTSNPSPPPPVVVPDPTPSLPPDTVPPADSPVVREPPGEDPAGPDYNVDLGCSGFQETETEFEFKDFVRDGSKFEDYTTPENQGWRATGDVQYSYDMGDVIFGEPGTGEGRVGGNYLDTVIGYCVLTTGNGLYKLYDDPTFQPGPAGGEQVSEMWQKVRVPTDAKSIQVRVAFMSQEFPQFVGTQYNDSFFIKFDESLDFIASGNLNDLAGVTNNDSTCRTKTLGSPIDCGEWKDMSFYTVGTGDSEIKMHGELYSIGASTTAQSKGRDYGCQYPGNDATDPVKCYHGMIAPRVICKNLTANEVDPTTPKLLTLRVNVSDVGDQYFDSALAVDSIVFSKKDCADDTGRITPDPLSRASDL